MPSETSIIAELLRKKREEDVSKAVDATESARLNKMVMEAMKQKESPKDVSPLLTAAKEFVQTTAPQEVLSPKLQEAATITEADERNPEARLAGLLAGLFTEAIPLDIGTKGVASKAFKEMGKDIAAKQRGVTSEVGALSPSEKQTLIENLSKDMRTKMPMYENEFKESGSLSPATIQEIRERASETTKLKAKDMGEDSWVVQDVDGGWHIVTAETETGVPTGAVPAGRGTNAVRTADGQVFMPWEIKRKSTLDFLSETDEAAANSALASASAAASKRSQEGAVKFSRRGQAELDQMPIVSKTEFKEIVVDPITGDRTIVYGPRSDGKPVRGEIDRIIEKAKHDGKVKKIDEKIDRRSVVDELLDRLLGKSKK
jgi:hypothetical protein